MMELVDVADSKSAASDGVPVRLRLPAPPPNPCCVSGLAVFLWKSEAISVASAVASLTARALLPGNPKSRKPCPAWAGGFSEVPEVIFRTGRRTSLSLYDSLIKRFKKICEADLRQTRRRTQAGFTPGKDDNEVSVSHFRFARPQAEDKEILLCVNRPQFRINHTVFPLRGLHQREA